MLKHFLKPSPRALMEEELREAERLLLAAQTSLEWSNANVSYNQARIKRLTAALAPATTKKPDSVVPVDFVSVSMGHRGL